MKSWRWVDWVARLFAEARIVELSRKSVLTLILFHLIVTPVEMLGVFSLVPVIEFLQSNGNVDLLLSQRWYWGTLREVFGTFGLPLNLGILLSISFTLLLVRQGVVFARLRFMARTRQNAMAAMRLKLFTAFLAARVDAQRWDTEGAMVNDMTTDLVRAVNHVLSLVTLIGLAILFVFYLASIILVSPGMTVLAVVVFGTGYLLLRSQMLESNRIGVQFTAANQEMSSFIVERLRQARLVRLAGMERAEREAMAGLVTRQRTAMTRIAYLLANIEVIIEPLVVGAGFLFLFIGFNVLGQPLSEIGVFLLILLRLMPAVKEASRTRQTVASDRSAFEAVASRLARLDEAKEVNPGGRSFEGPIRSIMLEGVSFNYPGIAVPAVNSIDLQVPARKLTALVGPSGAGKSTLLDLLPRLRVPTAGRILFDDVPQEAFDLVSLRDGIAFTPQSPDLFNVTIAQHIRYGAPGASDESVRSAARLANADDFIQALPKGYDSPIGEAGMRLSGGQRQRLDLARALVKGAPILLLDEPTSNLDAESETKFLAALQRIRSETETTLIVIAHRLSTVVMADQIVVLEAGRVRAIGRHDELVQCDEWYRNAFKAQQLSEDASVVSFDAGRRRLV